MLSEKKLRKKVWPVKCISVFLSQLDECQYLVSKLLMRHMAVVESLGCFHFPQKHWVSHIVVVELTEYFLLLLQEEWMIHMLVVVRELRQDALLLYELLVVHVAPMEFMEHLVPQQLVFLNQHCTLDLDIYT